MQAIKKFTNRVGRKEHRRDVERHGRFGHGGNCHCATINYPVVPKRPSSLPRFDHQKSVPITGTCPIPQDVQFQGSLTPPILPPIPPVRNTIITEPTNDPENEPLYVEPEWLEPTNPKENFKTDSTEPFYLPLDNESVSSSQREDDCTVVDGLRSPPSPTNAAKYPCHYPVNPRQKELEARLRSFSGKTDWPAYRFNATIQEFAIAGWFYLGEGDQTACWYCNVRLNNWDDEDEPWVEHAKWYPKCEFLLRSKGIEYVEEISEKFMKRKGSRNSM